MSDNIDPVEKPAEQPPAPVAPFSYPWMGVDQKGLLELNPRNLPSMLQRTYVKHKKAALLAGKGK